MFSSLNQGNQIYILDKTDNVEFKIGDVISISQPRPSYNVNSNIGFNQTYVDMKINVNGEQLEFNQIPSNLSLVSYSNGKLTLSETKQGLQNEVEGILNQSKQILSKKEYYEDSIKRCEQILVDLNPQFAKDKERDSRLTTLENKVSSVDDKLNQIITLIQK